MVHLLPTPIGSRFAIFFLFLIFFFNFILIFENTQKRQRPNDCQPAMSTPSPASSPPNQSPSHVPYRHRHQRVLPDLYEDAQDILPHEDLERYTAGGFHPVNLGDTFREGRYTIRHKLGYGGFSTVWLAHDRDAPQWVSIKVKSAAASTEDLDQDREISVLKQVERLYAESAGRQPMPCACLLDYFHHTGPNGTHNCLVMELIGPSLSHVLECYEFRGQTFRPDTVLRASCQLLDALDFLHQAGFAHGDVYNANVAFTCKIRDEEDLFKIIREPDTADYTSDQIPWSPELPKHLVGCTLWPDWYEAPYEDLRLIDLGEAFPVDSTVASLAQPRDVRAPETFFIGSFDYRHDLWRAGCVIYSLYHRERAFKSGLGKDGYFIAELTMKLGPLPDEWQDKWKELKEECLKLEE
ncbi:kinase-like domain-containing protein [Xylaria grammica]|nr:kinase-like domain-containing protein [Xylaria grammica]